MFRVLLTIGCLQALAMAIFLLRTKALALLLAPDGVGALAVVDKLIAVIAQTISLSLPYAAVRFLPGLWVQAPAAFVGLLRRMLLLLIILAVATALLALAVTLVYPQAWGSELLAYRSVLFVAFLSLPVVVLVPFLENAIAARLQPKSSMFFVILHGLVFMLTAVFGAWLNGLAGIYGLYATLGLLLVLPISWLVSRTPKQAPAMVILTEPTWLGLPGSIWKFTLTLFGLTFVMPYVALQIHYSVLSMHGAKVAGWMQAAVGLSLAVRTLLGKAQAIFFTPHVNRNDTPEQRMRWANEYQKTFGLLCTASVLPVLLFPNLLIGLLYSEQFIPGAPFASLFVLAEVILLFAGTYQGLVVALDHLGFHVAQNLAAQGMLLAGAIPLIKYYGIEGAGAATLCVPCFLYAGSILFLRWKYGLSPSRRDLFLTAFILLGLSAGAAVGTALTDFSPGVLVLKGTLYAACLAGLALFLSGREWEILKEFLQELGARLCPWARPGDSAGVAPVPEQSALAGP